MPDLQDSTAPPTQATTPYDAQKALADARRFLQQAQAAAQRGDQRGAQAAAQNARAVLPPNWLMDAETGQLQQKSWWQEYGGDVLALAAGFGGIGVGGFFLSGLNAAAPAAAGSLTGGATAATPAVTSGALTSGALPATALPAATTLAPGVAASGAVPAASTGASMAIPWGDIIRYGVQAGGNYLTSRNAENATQQASDAQIAAVNRSLDLQNSQYQQGRADVQRATVGLSPYQAIGQSSLGRLYSLTGQRPPSASQGVTPQNYLGQTGFVYMQGPDGSVKPVSSSDEAKWTALGARRVS